MKTEKRKAVYNIVFKVKGINEEFRMQVPCPNIGIPKGRIENECRYYCRRFMASNYPDKSITSYKKISFEQVFNTTTL